MRNWKPRPGPWLTFGLAGIALAGAALAPGAPLIQTASAKPPAPMAFCHAYPEAKACNTGSADCVACPTTPPARNAFGMQISEKLAPGVARPLTGGDFLKYLPVALEALERSAFRAEQ